MPKDTAKPTAIGQEQDHPPTSLKSARKGVTDWVQQRLLKVPHPKKISSSPDQPSCGPSHLAPQVPLSENLQSSPNSMVDRLYFPVGFMVVDLDPSTIESNTLALYLVCTCGGFLLPFHQCISMRHYTNLSRSSSVPADLLDESRGLLAR
jgi:hypothetical protein